MPAQTPLRNTLPQIDPTHLQPKATGAALLLASPTSADSWTRLPTGAAPSLDWLGAPWSTPFSGSGGAATSALSVLASPTPSDPVAIDAADADSIMLMGEESEASRQNAARLHLLARRFAQRVANPELEARLSILNERLNYLMPQVTEEALTKMAGDLEDSARRVADRDAQLQALGVQRLRGGRR
jgi:hypothetical protein